MSLPRLLEEGRVEVRLVSGCTQVLRLEEIDALMDHLQVARGLVSTEIVAEAREARADFERRYASGGGCSCHISPPCGYCTDPDNPANQDEDDSCWTEKVPDVVAEDPSRFMLSGLPSPFGGFVLSACVDCDHSDRCGETPLPAMNVQQREWCLHEINAVEGWNRDDYEAVPDQELARAVVQAWGDYARDKGVA